jgi:hypothetical protein
LLRLSILLKTVYDAYLPEFNAMTELSASIRPLFVSSSNSMFRFDIGMIPALSQAGMYCKNKTIRAEGIHLLFAMKVSREGIWDSFATGRICDWFRIIEEEFIDENGYVLAERRVSLISMEISLLDDKAHIRCMQRTGFGVDNFVIRETTLNRVSNFQF